MGKDKVTNRPMKNGARGRGVVVARILGGLGNQMFQYAAARSLASRCQVPLLLDFRSFRSDDLRQPGLFGWRVEAQVARPRQLWRYPELALAIARRYAPAGRGMGCYTESSLRFDERWPLLKPPVHVSGYFQSERYFLDIRTHLLREFVPADGLDSRSAAVAGHAEACNSIAVHIRRGDYVSDPKTSAVHGSCDLEYYRAAVDCALERTGPATFFIFSDDMAWVRRELQLPGNVVYVEGKLHGPERDIHLMSRCRHIICANSSFSWWGAWLNDRPDKVVIAPRRWFAASDLDSTDIVPPTWLRVGGSRGGSESHG